jgi:hypothetical protein
MDYVPVFYSLCGRLGNVKSAMQYPMAIDLLRVQDLFLLRNNTHITLMRHLPTYVTGSGILYFFNIYEIILCVLEMSHSRLSFKKNSFI